MLPKNSTAKHIHKLFLMSIVCFFYCKYMKKSHYVKIMQINYPLSWLYPPKHFYENQKTHTHPNLRFFV